MRKVSRAQDYITDLNFKSAVNNDEGEKCMSPNGVSYESAAATGGRTTCGKPAVGLGFNGKPTCGGTTCARIEYTNHLGSASEGHYQYIHKRGDKWVVVQKGTGKVLSTHDSEADAISSFKAMMMNKHGSAEHSCDVGDHKVHEDVRCVTPGCEHRGKSWEQDGHQDWDHDYACSEHFTKGATTAGYVEPEQQRTESLEESRTEATRHHDDLSRQWAAATKLVTDLGSGGDRDRHYKAVDSLFDQLATEHQHSFRGLCGRCTPIKSRFQMSSDGGNLGTGQRFDGGNLGTGPK